MCFICNKKIETFHWLWLLSLLFFYSLHPSYLTLFPLTSSCFFSPFHVLPSLLVPSSSVLYDSFVSLHSCCFIYFLFFSSQPFTPFISLPLPLLFLCAGKQDTPEQILSEFLLFRYTRPWTHTREGASGTDWLGFKLQTCSMAAIISVAVKSHLLLLSSSWMCSVQRARSSHHVSR